ncbi:MAG: lipoyl synthase, partial [Candidatus Omnitrophica bacterium]|nr:lipoyl synthase [Candidatus Omnitrophota bacterium]
DDLQDGGADQFVKVVEAVRAVSSTSKVEILVPDFGGRIESIEKVLEVKPAVFSHNIETVKRLYPIVRAGASYSGSLDLLKMAKKMDPRQLTKSSIMVGLGESEEELMDTMDALRIAGCDILTIGQYLKPGKDNVDIKRFVTPEEFEHYKMLGEANGFKFVSSGPYIRSSYNAFHIYKELKEIAHEGCLTAAIG